MRNDSHRRVGCPGLVKAKVEIKLPKVVRNEGSISNGCNAAAD